MEAGWGRSIVAYNSLCKLNTHHAGQVRGIGLSLFQHVRPCSSLVNVSPSSSWLMPEVWKCVLCCAFATEECVQHFVVLRYVVHRDFPVNPEAQLKQPVIS